MSSKITWLGHGAFEIQTGGQTLLIDPFLTDNPSASTTADAVKPDVIIITHGHGDHVGDAVAIAKLSGDVQRTRVTKLYAFDGLQRTGLLHISGQWLAGLAYGRR